MPGRDGVDCGSAHRSCKRAGARWTEAEAKAEAGGLTGRRRRCQDRVNPVRGEVDKTGTPNRTGVIAEIGWLRVDRPKFGPVVRRLVLA